MSEPLRVAPILTAFELLSSEDLTATVQIQSCRDCAPWFIELEPRDGHVLIREWHDPDCPHLRALLQDDAAAVADALQVRAHVAHP